MADLPAPREQYLVAPDTEIKKKWMKSAIASKEAQVKRLEADKEEIINSQVLQIEAKILMLKKEVVQLHNDLMNLDPIDV